MKVINHVNNKWHCVLLKHGVVVTKLPSPYNDIDTIFSIIEWNSHTNNCINTICNKLCTNLKQLELDLIK